MTFKRFALDRSTPSRWPVTFNNPPINLIDCYPSGTEVLRRLGVRENLKNAFAQKPAAAGRSR